MSRRSIDWDRGRVSWDQTGTGDDLVVLHSLLTDRHAFDPVVPHWSARRRVNLVDLPGFGESARVTGGIEEFADAIGGLLDSGGFDPGRTDLVGNGLGAFVALATAIRHGTRFRRLCLVGCGAAFPEAAREVFARMADAVLHDGMGAVVDTAVRRIFPDSYLASHPQRVAERREVLLRTDPEAFATACRALQDLDLRDQIARVENPALIVVGSEDGATPPQMAEELDRLLPRSQLRRLEHVGHAPQLQEPHRFMAAVEDFLFEPSGIER